MPLAVIILQILATYGPKVAEAAVSIAHSSNPTQEDWQDLFKLAEKPYDKFIEEAEARAAK